LLAAGPVGSDDIWKAAKANGIAGMTLKRAKKQLGVVARHRPDLAGGWEWVLPEEDQKNPKGTTNFDGPLRESWSASDESQAGG
jgi:hypothetical protein